MMSENIESSLNRLGKRFMMHGYPKSSGHVFERKDSTKASKIPQISAVRERIELPDDNKHI